MTPADRLEDNSDKVTADTPSKRIGGKGETTHRQCGHAIQEMETRRDPMPDKETQDLPEDKQTIQERETRREISDTEKQWDTTGQKGTAGRNTTPA